MVVPEHPARNRIIQPSGALAPEGRIILVEKGQGDEEE